jgi:hypothetical protein
MSTPGDGWIQTFGSYFNVLLSPTSSLNLRPQEPDPQSLSWWEEDYLQWESHIIADANGDYLASVNIHGNPVEADTEIIVGHAKVFLSEGASAFKLPFHLEAHSPTRAIVRIRLSTAIIIASKTKIEVLVDFKRIQYPYSSVPVCNLVEDVQQREIFTSSVLVNPGMAMQSRIHRKTGDRLIVGEFADIVVETSDAFGNAVPLTDSRLSLRARVDSAGNSELLSDAFRVPNIVHLTRTASGAYNLHISLISWIGLSATYFASSSLAFPVSSRSGAVIDFSTSEGQQEQGSLAFGMPFSVRWAGFIRPSFAQIFTMHAVICAADERIRLWIDNNLVVDMWQSLSGTDGSGIANFDEAHRYYDIKVEYKQYEGCAGAQLSWSRDAFASTKSFSAEELGVDELSLNSPLSILFFADTPSIYQTKLIGNPLTVGTSCAENSFTIRARDQYGNTAMLSEENIKVRIYPSPLSLLDHSRLYYEPDVGELHPNCNNPSSEFCIVSYKLKASGNFLLNIELKQSDLSGDIKWLAVHGTPSELLISPGPPKTFVVYGNAISIVSAGAMSEFSIVAYDCGRSKTDIGKSGLISTLSIMTSQSVGSWQRVLYQEQTVNDWALHIQYRVTSSGIFFLSVMYFGLHIGDSPFVVQCLPGPVSGPVSVVTISLSLSTAGIYKFQLFAFILF